MGVRRDTHLPTFMCNYDEAGIAPQCTDPRKPTKRPSSISCLLMGAHSLPVSTVSYGNVVHRWHRSHAPRIENWGIGVWEFQKICLPATRGACPLGFWLRGHFLFSKNLWAFQTVHQFVATILKILNYNVKILREHQFYDITTQGRVFLFFTWHVTK